MPDDPQDAAPPEDEQASPWATRPLGRVPQDAAPNADPDAPRRSIFNRFRRGRATADLQAHLLFPEEELADLEVDEAPALAPARSQWRRPDDARPASHTPTAPGTSSPSRLTPPIEAILPAEMVESPEDAGGPEPAPESTIAAPDLPSPAVAVPPVAASATPPTLDVPAVLAQREPQDAVSVEPSTVASPLEPDTASVASVTAPEEPTFAPPLPPAAASTFEAFDDEEQAFTVTSTDASGDREPARGWGAFRPIPVPINPYMVLLTGIATLVTMAYLLVEPSPRWFLIMGAVAVAGGLDGALRATWRVTYLDRDPAPALFMPALFILAVPPLIEHNVRGLGVVPAGLATGLAFFVIVAGQVGSARPGASYYPWARTVSTAGAYATGFAFFSLTYVYDLGITISALATGLVALMLAIEVLREGEIDSTETAGYAAAAGAAVGQWRLALHYLPVDGYLAGLAVVLGFLVVTGLLQAYITRSLDRRTTIDHAAIATAGAVLVVGARVAGLA